LFTSVTKSDLATAEEGPMIEPIPTNLTVTIAACADLDLTTVTRITVAVLITIFALVIASTRLVAAADTVDDEVSNCGEEVVESVTTSYVELIIREEELGEAFIVEGIATLGFSRITTNASENVTPSTLSTECTNASNFLTVAPNGADDLTNVEGRSVGDVSGTRSVVVEGIRTHGRAVEFSDSAAKVITKSLLATVTPAACGTLIFIEADSVTNDNASVKVASELSLIEGFHAAETKRRGKRAWDILASVVDTEVLDLRIIIDVGEGGIVIIEGTDTTTAIRTTRALVDRGRAEILVDRVVDTRDVVAVTARTASTARFMRRSVLATVAGITVAVKVTVGCIANVDATTSSGGANIGVASDVSSSEVAGVDSAEFSAIEGSNEGDVVLRVRHVRSSELILKMVTVIREAGNQDIVVNKVEGVLNEGGAVDDRVEHVVTGSSAPELPEVSTVIMGDVAEGLSAVLAERSVMLATISEVLVAVNPAGFASELALTSPVIAGLTIARLNMGKVEAEHLQGSHEGTAVVALATRVVEGGLATGTPVVVGVLAEIVLADAEVAAAAIGSTHALAPVEGVETIEGVALNTVAARAASAVIEDVSLATGHGVIIAILPAVINVALEVALTSIRLSRVVHAGDPGGDGVGVEVRAREDVAVTSEVVISGERPELEEWAPDTTDLSAN